MASFPDDQTLFLPAFAVSDEAHSSARYRWSCQDRGPEPFVIVQWTKSGCGIFRYEGCDHPVLPATAFVAIVPENAEYRFEAGAPGPWRFAWINFYGALSLQLWRTLRAVAGPVFPLKMESEAGQSFTQLITDTTARRFADRYEASAAGYLFFMTLCRQLNAPPTDFVGSGSITTMAVRRAATGRSPRHYTGVKLIASEAGVTREHFSRAFKAEHGESPGKFLRLQRLRAASEIIRTTALPLKEIALRCGFTSARHLADAFRSHYGQPPQRFRAEPEGNQ